ncbi:hypothetical protein GGI35DRAFT_464556 [Trichoderma velutinum]
MRPLTLQTITMILASLTQGHVMKVREGVVDAHHEISMRELCKPGQWKCQSGEIRTCNGIGQWVLSAICGPSDDCCRAPNGMPHCYC